MKKFHEEVNLSLENGSFLLEFYARWCGTCRQVSKAMIALENKFNFEMIQVDIEQSKEFTKSYHIKGVPVVILLKDGVEIERKSGTLNEKELLDWLNSINA